LYKIKKPDGYIRKNSYLVDARLYIQRERERERERESQREREKQTPSVDAAVFVTTNALDYTDLNELHV